MKQEMIEKVREIAERVGGSEGIEIVDIQLLGGGGNRVLRIFIDRDGGASVGDCENISHQVGTILDIEDVIPGNRYTLEVSTPGVERKLTKPRDFERFTGHRIKLALREPIESQKRVDGMLAAFHDGIATVETRQGKKLQIPFDLIEKANLKFEW